MKTIKNIFSLAMLLPLTAWGQQLHSDYIDWGPTGIRFSTALWDWEAGQQLSDDDNFFISRIKPKQRFRDPLTQVNPELTADVDKKLCMWMPIGTVPYNALPDGAFDRDVFSMWQYVTHYGNWTASLGRVPGAFSDVAHKNGVGVSTTASIPYGGLSSEWRTALQDMVDIGAFKMLSFLNYYGIDGIGYNSEFSTSNTKFMNSLTAWHQTLTTIMRRNNPLFEIVWYDGTNGYGSCTFDQGLGDHNVGTFGKAGGERSNLFLNYNWNNTYVLDKSLKYAESIGRNPLDLYCGFNMQGREPRSGTRWPLLQQYPFSIGLWGAHNENMFYESRGERGYNPLVRQETYTKRLEMWFTGGTQNPIDKHEVSNSMRYDTDNTDFFGMSSLMSARSSLSWDLGNEPFVTSFSLGNGMAYYWHGQRTSDREWYNIGTQDYLPTWRWWFAKRLLGRTSDDVPTGITARFTWDDAWNGGSSLQISGTDMGTQYLHLFKTLYDLQSDDRVSITFKRLAGSPKVALVLTNADGIVQKMPLDVSEETVGEWVTRSLTISKNFPEMAGNTLRLIALEIAEADGMDVLLGNLSIARGEYSEPLQPQIERTSLLARHLNGCDAKLIWDMPGASSASAVRYNLDVNASLFHLYAQAEGGEPQLMGATTSWAGIVFSAPSKSPRVETFVEKGEELSDDGEGLSEKGEMIRVGVSAVNLDMTGESEICWGDWMSVLDAPFVGDSIENDTLPEQEYPATAGRKPQILTLNAGDSHNPATVNYTALDSDGALSRAIDLGEKAFGVRCSDIRSKDKTFFQKSFSVACWIRPEHFYYATQLLNIRDKSDRWSYTDWGWFWHMVSSEGKDNAFSLRGNGGNQSYAMPELRLRTGRWHHLAYVFDQETADSVSVRFYVDGKLMTGQPSVNIKRGDTYAWRDKNVLAMGGNMFSAGGLDGQLDDMRLYDKALTSSDVSSLAKGQEASDEPAMLWDFEDDAQADGTFLSKGKLAGVPAGLHRYLSGESEGEGSLLMIPVEKHAMGAPDLPGTAWKVTTADRWIYDQSLLDVLGTETTPTRGSAVIKAQKSGDYAVTLVRYNDFGADSLSVNVNIDAEKDVDDAVGVVEYDGNGKATAVYDLLGRRVKNTSFPLPSHGLFVTLHTYLKK